MNRKGTQLIHGHKKIIVSPNKVLKSSQNGLVYSCFSVPGVICLHEAAPP